MLYNPVCMLKTLYMSNMSTIHSPICCSTLGSIILAIWVLSFAICAGFTFFVISPPATQHSRLPAYISCIARNTRLYITNAACFETIKMLAGCHKSVLNCLRRLHIMTDTYVLYNCKLMKHSERADLLGQGRCLFHIL